MGRCFEWFPNHRKFLDQSNCVVTDSLRIIQQSTGFRQRITTNWSNKTDKGGGGGQGMVPKTKIAI